MYDELVEQLRAEGNWLGFTERLRNLFIQSADAIEELQEDNAALNGTVSNLIEQIAELSKPHWVLVTERLPEMYQPVLTFDGMYHAVEMRVPYVLDEEGKQIESDWWVGADNDINAEYYNGLRDGAADYWMPLPEPPKAENQSET